MSESEMSQESIDYARLQEEYGGKYVATLGDEVIASAEKYSELARALAERGGHTGDVVVEYVRPKGRICVY